MKLRGKVLVLLLLTAVLPVLAVRLVDGLTLMRLGRSVGERAGGQVEQLAEGAMRRAVADYADLVEREGQLMEALIRLQALAVERRLSGEPALIEPSGGLRAEPLEAFNRGAVPGLVTLPGYERHIPRRAPEPVPVSYDAAVMLTSPGIELDDLAPQRDRLLHLADAYRAIRSQMPDAIFWQYTTLSSGLHVSYPGKGGYPSDYEPRTMPWFLRAITSDGPVWLPPQPDTVTGKTVITVAMRIRDTEGKPIGVTAIDVPMDRVLQREADKGLWFRSAIACIVSAEDADTEQRLAVSYDTPGKLLAVFAGTEASLNPLRRHEGFLFRGLRFDDASHAQEVWASVKEGREGTLTTAIAGRAMKLSWGPVSEQFPTAVLVAVPLADLQREAQQLAEEVWTQTTTAAWRSGALVLITIGLVSLIAWRTSRVVTQPVTALAQAADHIAQGRLDAHVDLPRPGRHDEIGDMARAFNAMVPKLREHLKLTQSLGLAMEVQQSLLPQEPPSFRGFDIAGVADYCDETGGDYFDFLDIASLGDQHLGVALGDVTGHGIAAALLMCTGRALLRSGAGRDGTLAELFAHINDHLCAAGFHGRFMTLFYLTIQREPLAVRYISAGHDPALVYDPDTDTFTELAGGDVPLGVTEGWAFSEFRQDSLPERAVIVLGTDGIWEARDPTDRMYGKQRWQQVIREHHTQTAAQLCDTILRDVARFRAGREQLDDITLVVLKRQPADVTSPSIE